MVYGVGFEIIDVGKCDIYFDLYKKEELTSDEEREMERHCKRALELLIQKIYLDFNGDEE